MDLREFLGRLTGVKATGNGEYVCRCPAHDDRTASLCVRDGEKGIVLKCQAGCSTEAVLQSMGLQMFELFREPLRTGDGNIPTRQRGADAAKRDGRAGSADAVAKVASEQGSGNGASAGARDAAAAVDEVQTKPEFVCAYPYRDERGNLLFEACRYRLPEGKKTFRLRTPDANARGGWKYSAKGARLVLYRLPELLEGIRKRQPVFIVEGEKDVDNLARLGYTATTNPMGAGKWKNGDYTESLRDAEVYIIPDNDDVGRQHAAAVAADILGVAKQVKLIALTDGCIELPPKGDITDFFKLLGRERGEAALARLMREAAVYERNPRDIAIAYYNELPGYIIDEGRICSMSADGAPKPLGNFIALPREVVLIDDGVSQTKELLIDGWSAGGARLPRVRIRSNVFASMSWVPEHWDYLANILPGNQTRDRLRYAISEVGQKSAERRTEYCHTGWRKLGGKWVFLYHGGAIGADDVSVNMQQGLNLYRMDGSGSAEFERISYYEAGSTSLMLRGIISDNVAVPLLGTTYLAPLREFLNATGIAPAYTLFLCGGTGTRKSTAAALALSHYGNFNSRSLPASFNDTANAIRRKAFMLKDVPIVVDDYHPVSSLQERKKMESVAQSLSRAFGDGADRGGLNSDMRIRAPMPPRGIAIISGEDTPNVAQSGLARYYIVPVGKEDIPITKELTQMQEYARQGYLQKAMCGYIVWLSNQADELPELLHKLFIEHRERAGSMMSGGAHARSPESIAHIMLGYEMMLLYMRDIGVLEKEQCLQELDYAWNLIVDASKQQAEELKTERPSKQFLTMLGELLATRAAGVVDLTDASAGRPKEMIGYSDALYYYLLPNAAYRAVAKLCRDQGNEFPLTMRMLAKQLREDDCLIPDEKGPNAKVKWVEGRAQRLLWIPRNLVDGEREQTPKQMKLPLNAHEGFEEVDDADIPDEFKGGGSDV